METDTNGTVANNNVLPPIEEQRKTACADLASLSRVSHRLALVDSTEKFQMVLDKLLPRLLQRIGDNNQTQRSTNDVELRDTLSKIHIKLVEMMSHIMKRVRDDQRCKLNTNGILQLLLEYGDNNNNKTDNVVDNVHPKARDCDSFSLNLSLAFLTIAVPRCTVQELETILPGLLILNAYYEIRVEQNITSSSSSSSLSSSKKQWHQVSHLLLRTFELIILQDTTSLKHAIGIQRQQQQQQPYSNNNNNGGGGGGHHNNKNKRIKHSTDEEKKENSASNPQHDNNKKDGLEEARQLLATNPLVASACYELFLDALLYQTEVGTVPPPGLSSAGWERLKGGHSSTERDWAAEMAPRNRLCDFKTRLLEWIAPSRRRALFVYYDTTPSSDNDDEDGDSKSSGPTQNKYSLGLSRTVALLVTASGDPMQGVTEPAKQYLKQHWDTQQRDGGGSFGDPAILTKELLGLAVGGINAEMVLSSSSSSSSSSPSSGAIGPRNNGSLTMTHVDVTFRRRQVSDTNFAELVGTATRAIDELLEGDLYAIGKLAILATDKMLSKLRNALGLTLSRGRPYIVAAELLNAVVVRLEKTDEGKIDPTERWALDGRALTLAADVLAPVAASQTLSTGASSEANVAVRDSIYGTVSIICRSTFAKERFLTLMAAGNLDVNDLSIDLFQLLLRCVGNEVDKLRLRATAALDALLFACRRGVDESDEAKSVKDQLTDSNPWGQVISSSDDNINTTNNDSKPSTSLRTELSRSLFPILWNASRKAQSRQVRVAAARWSSDLLVDLDIVSATHLLCFLAGDSDATASAVSREGLRLDGNKTFKFPDFSDLVGVLLVELVDSTSRPNFWDFSTKGKAVAIRCILRSYLDDFHGGSENDIRLFVESLTKCLAWNDDGTRSGDLFDACSEALCICLETSASARAMLHSSSLPLDARGLRDLILTAKSSPGRRYLSDAFCHLLMDTSLFEFQWIEIVKESLSLSSDFIEGEPLRPTADVYGGALLGGTCVRLCRLNGRLVESSVWSQSSRVLKRLGEGVAHADDSIGNVFCDAISKAFTGESVECDVHDSMIMATTVVLERIASAVGKFGNGDRVNSPRVTKLVEPAGLALAVAAAFPGLQIAPARTECVDALINLLGSDAFRKDEEVALSVGEALATLAEVYKIPTDSVEWERLASHSPFDMDPEFASISPAPVQIVSTLLRTAKTTSNNHKRRACAAALLAIVARATTSTSDRILRSFLQRHLHEVQDSFLFLLADAKSTQLSRESCCLGLAACDKLVIASESDELKWRLLKSFGQTTNHGGSAMQETPQQAEERRRSEGMEIDEIGGNMSVVDTGGAAGMSEASLGAYREMASAAVAAGRPDILYSLLILSVSHSIWFSSEKRMDAYGPAALQSLSFGKDEVKTALRPYLGRLLPRVLRASHDPNKQTRVSMETLWVGLTGGGEEGRSAITEHLRPTMDTLIEDTSSKFWRARVGACGALGQIIVGRSWQDLGGGPAVLDENYDLVLSKTSSESTLGGIRLLRLWRAATRALDDVRIAVRESGESLARSVRSLTINLCSPDIEASDGSVQDHRAKEKDAISASATCLSWLLRDGLKQQSPEAAGICVSALIGIIDVAKPAILEALLSDVIFALLMALSNLEPAAFSYLAVRQESGSTDYENLARLRIQASQSSPLAVAIRKCLAMTPKASQKNQEAVVPAIESAIRKSAGMATRTTAAECVITLCHSCPEMFRSNTSSSSLLRCFFEAVFQERSGKAVQDKMVSAFGSLAALCPGTTVRSLATSATERYKHAHGNNDDSAARLATAMVLRSLAVKSSNHFSDGGNSDIWCQEVLPISFLGMRDPDANVASLWKEVWEDGGAAVDLGSTEDDAPTLDEKLLLSLATECVKALEDVSWSRRVAAAEALSDLADRGILAPPPRRLSGEFSVSDVRRAKKRADASRLALSSLVELIARNRIWSGKKVIVQSAVKVVTQWVDLASRDDLKSVLGDPGLVPITFGDKSAEDDLFVSDRWFETAAEMEDCDQDDSQQSGDHKLVEESPGLAFVGLCRLLLMQAFPSGSVLRAAAEEDVLPNRSEVLRCLDLVLHSLSLDRQLHIETRSQIFALTAPKLLSVIGDYSTKESPLIVARCIDCFAACFWRGIQFQHNDEESPSIAELSTLFLHHADLTKQAAWTVREASAKAASRIAQCAHLDTLRQRRALGSLIDISTIALRDKRFWKVRLAGVEVLYQIVLRAGNVTQVGGTGLDEDGVEKQLMLESILPHKESIQSFASRCLTDPEAAVTALSTKVLNAMATWP